MKPKTITKALLAVAFVLTILPNSSGDQAQYFYDELGRLSGVTDSTGKTAIYAYDAVGNLLSIQTNTPPGDGIGIYLLAPGSGGVSTQVKIQGYGFDTTPANNTVAFNGTSAL